jgi:REP element-mobilizing transposase RayT
VAHVFTILLTRVVFSTSERAPFLSDTIRSDVHAYIGGIMRQMHAAPIAIGGMVDHIHVLTRLPADLAIADYPRVAKTNSSRWAHERASSACFISG